MNFRFRTLAASGMLVSSFALLFLMGGCNRSDKRIDAKAGFAKQLDFELFLKAHGQKEDRREVTYWPGTRTLKTVRVFYVDGGLLVSSYRDNGTVSSLSEWYSPNTPAGTTAISTTPADGTNPAGSDGSTPATADSATPAVDPNKPPQLKRTLEYAADGVTIVKASYFRFDGTLQADGHVLADGTTFQLVDYNDKGKAQVKRQLFTQDGEPIYVHMLQGDQVKTLTIPRKDATETVTFGDSGYRVSRSILVNNSPQFETVDFYKADGIARKYTIFRRYKISAVFYKDDGTVSELRSFDNSEMTVVKFKAGTSAKSFDPDNSAQPGQVYRQVFKIVTDSNSKESYVPERIETLNDSGKLVRRLNFDDSGKLNRVEYYDPQTGDHTKSVTLRDDGTVDNIDEWQKQPDGSTKYTETPVDQSKGLREKYDERLAAPGTFVDPRPLVGPAVQQPYYDYEGYED